MPYPIVKAKDASGVEFEAYEVIVDDQVLYIDTQLAHASRYGYEAYIEHEIRLLKRHA